jgi:hypothetical protein
MVSPCGRLFFYTLGAAIRRARYVERMRSQAAAVVEFNLSDDQRKRVVVQERD